MAIAGPTVLTADEVFGLEKRECGVNLRYTNAQACQNSGCKVCVNDVSVCNVSC
ncbi:uncharacterized protein M421DRAFT_425161 [Didymella exigua CBS 183.55]|uniref:Uncharacterized protein n=1 Tax=Didymella exigua CBS 183.55 TaxID=1150837 RepID=A0A6A5R8N4_9PLEO|nr:uncharacterized protein M421DRAFT_425161 [Didymella exigua CBS 183.55]KAF1923993.1 hypothetical protein M421DRAFT_425161 [Didymella exigua CBS 183.55]